MARTQDFYTTYPRTSGGLETPCRKWPSLRFAYTSYWASYAPDSNTIIVHFSNNYYYWYILHVHFSIFHIFYNSPKFEYHISSRLQCMTTLISDTDTCTCLTLHIYSMVQILKYLLSKQLNSSLQTFYNCCIPILQVNIHPWWWAMQHQVRNIIVVEIGERDN